MFFNNGQKSNMTCSLRVRDTQDREWFKTLNKILKKIKGLSYEYRNEGVIYISGRVDPQKIMHLIAKYGNKVELCGMKTGHRYVSGPSMARSVYPSYHHNGIGYYPPPMPPMPPMPYTQYNNYDFNSFGSYQHLPYY